MNTIKQTIRELVKEVLNEQDHEVSMAQTSLDSIVKNATELKQKIGKMEKNIPGWIQDHIVNSENYIEQANSGYHEIGETKINEASEVEFDTLTPAQQKKVQALAKVLSGKPTTIFEGIHGMVVYIKVSNAYGPYRFDADVLKKLLALKIRWVEADKSAVIIGF